MDIRPIGYVTSSRAAATDDHWGGQQARITPTPEFAADAFEGLSSFSHVEVLFLFHQVDPTRIVTGARHRRTNTAWPVVGIFAQRGKDRPNRLGSTICRAVKTEGTTLTVAELDALDGTPVLDLKPVMAEFLPRGPVRQPAWSRELMREYWTQVRQG